MLLPKRALTNHCQGRQKNASAQIQQNTCNPIPSRGLSEWETNLNIAEKSTFTSTECLLLQGKRYLQGTREEGTHMTGVCSNRECLFQPPLIVETSGIADTMSQFQSQTFYNSVFQMHAFVKLCFLTFTNECFSSRFYFGRAPGRVLDPHPAITDDLLELR